MNTTTVDTDKIQENVTKNELYWSVFAIYIISFVISALIFTKEISKRKNDIIIANDPYPKWLNLWSTISFLLYLLIFLITIPRLFVLNTNSIFNIVGASITLFPLFGGGVFVTMYQITRLKYCFSSHSAHFIQYGYNKYVFIILYFIGILLIISNVVLVIYVTCSIRIIDYEAYVDTSPTKDIILVCHTFAQLLVYHIWNIIVLILFLYKMCHIKYLTKRNEQHLNKRINFILTKITTLSVLFQFKELLLDVMPFIVSQAIDPNKDRDQMIQFMIWGVDTLLSVIFMYLMIQHNNKEYMMIICCCSKSVINYDELDKNRKVFKLEKSKKETTTNTQDLVQVKYALCGVQIDVTNYGTDNGSVAYPQDLEGAKSNDAAVNEDTNTATDTASETAEYI